MKEGYRPSLCWLEAEGVDGSCSDGEHSESELAKTFMIEHDATVEHRRGMLHRRVETLVVKSLNQRLRAVHNRDTTLNSSHSVMTTIACASFAASYGVE